MRRARKERLYQVVGPSYPLMRKTSIRTFEEIAKLSGRLVSFNKSLFEAKISTEEGGLADVYFRSADNPDSLRGPNLSGCWIDEASFTAFEAYKIIVASLRERGERGWLTATFTPRGKRHWTYEVFGKPKANTQLFHCPTSGNPFLPEGFEADIGEHYGHAMKQQELGGEFVDGEGVLLSYEEITSCVDEFCLWPKGEPQPNTRPHLFMGVDFGRSKHNTVLWTWEKLGDVAVCRELKVIKRTAYQEQIDEILSRMQRRQYSRAFMDRGVFGDVIVEQVSKKYPGVVVGVAMNPDEQARLANKFAAAVQQRKVRLPDDLEMKQDFQLVSSTITKNGREVMVTEEDETGHADRFWAAALGYNALSLFAIQPKTVSAPSVHRPKGFR